MPRIHQLDAHVADLIAAGEVVERPASAVKELTENAIDAGASMVTVEIQQGGMSYIRVTDNGCGIEPEDCLVAFLRHATSKIRTEYDLEAIGTLGFRGEALAAIASVSKIEMMTRTENNAAGTSLVLEGGTVISREEIGCPVGTTLIVRDLFFNTPARQKFLKRDTAEGAAVLAVMQHAALSHPEVSFRMLRDGKEVLSTPGDGNLKSAMYAVLGRDIALGFTSCRSTGDEISVEGFVSQPVCCRGSRATQFFFVNGRYVKSRTMQAALEQAYQNQKMVGKFPGCVLHITAKLSGVDVNVHPTKTEVKFTNDKKLFDGIYYAVKGALEMGSETPKASLETRKQIEKHDTVTPNQTFFRTITAKEFREENRSAAPVVSLTEGKSVPVPDSEPEPIVSIPTAPPFPTRTVPSGEERKSPSVEPPRIARPEGNKPKADDRTAALFGRSSIGSISRSAMPIAPPVIVHAEEPETPKKESTQETVAEQKAAERPVDIVSVMGEQPADNPEKKDWRMVGEVLHTYVVVEQGDEVWFIDKHAAHERMNFDKLKAMKVRPMSQLLLKPLVLRFGPEECNVILENLSVLEDFAFSIEDFGGNSLLVREAPDYLPVEKIESSLGEIATTLLTTGTADPDAARDEVLHTMACKSAIKGGWTNAEEELAAVCEAVMSGAVRYCPHGRPVAIRLSKGDFEKQFKRA